MKSTTARLCAVVVAGWAAVAVVFAVQGQAVSLWRGAPQAWWPSLGYSLAIFSVWAVLTLPLRRAVLTVEAHVAPAWRRVALYLAGYPIVAAAHVGLFVLAYWPLYNDGGRIATRWSMGERMFLSNFDTNTIFYGLVVVIVVAADAHLRRVAASSQAAAQPPALAASGGPVITVKIKGGHRLLSAADIDWIGAAGDYVEIDAGGNTHLLEESLASLCGRLPADQFARIHRATVVRLDRISEVRSLGRGDATVRLVNGAELRLSRRYRGNLAPWLAGRSRPPGSAVPLGEI